MRKEEVGPVGGKWKSDGMDSVLLLVIYLGHVRDQQLIGWPLF